MTVTGPQPDAAAADAGEDRLLTDFTAGGAGPGWYVVNDNVMGGRSEGDFRMERGELRFAGRTNTDGGGFSSIRTEPVRLDLSDHAGIRLRVKGDGRRYTWRLATGERYRGSEVGYWAEFDTGDGDWRVVDIPFSRFVPKYRGTLLDGPALDPGRITGMGLMIYDKQDGPFELRLASVHAYSAPAHFTLVQYRWKNRVLVASAPAEDDANLERLRDEVAASRDEFTDRDLVLVTLLDDGTSTAGGLALTAEEAASTRAALGIRPGAFALRLIGKDGAVKLSAETATPVAEIYALIDTMPMRRRERSER